ncbi:uncharacterized protein LOC141885240 [Acropora palmata]|uniref:uncharacterized protein LOC141885240 n=1 Tax=Acropora palmata TaxID=6131 RepID=UPI003DA03D1A
MEKKSLMPSSLAILSILLCVQLCCCVFPRTDGLDMEAAAFQNCKCIELQEGVNKLTEEQRECKAEIQQLKDKVDGFFKNLSEKLQVLLPTAPTSDERGQYAGSSSCNETSLEGRPMVDGASLKSQPNRNWECQGAQPKSTQMPCPVGVDDRKSHNANVNSQSQSSQFGEKEPIPGSFTPSAFVAETVDNFLPKGTVLSSTASSAMVVSNSTFRPSAAVPSNISSNVLDTKGNSISSPTEESDAKEESSLLPMSGELISKCTLSRRDYGKANDNSLTASEQGTAKQEEFVREMQRKEQLTREEQERKRQEEGDRKWQEVERHYAANSYCNETSPDRRLQVEGASLKRQPEDDKKKFVSGVSVRSSALSGEADGGVISGNQEDNSFASFSSFESSAENEREIPVSRDTEDYEGLPLKSVRIDGKEDTYVSFSADKAGPSSILSSSSSKSSDSLVLNINDGVQVSCLRSGTSDSCNEAEPTEMFLATASGFSDGIKKSLNAGGFEDEIPREAHFSDSEDNVTDVSGNNETVVDDVPGTCIELCREGLILGDGNQVSLQHNSIEHDKRTVGRSECDPDCSAKAENQPPPENNPSEPDQVTEGCREPDAAHSFDTNWERQGARPKRTQMQRPMDPPLWPISSPVSDGLAKDFLARHSQDRAFLTQSCLYTDDEDLSSVGPERLRDASFVDGPTSASGAWDNLARHSQDRSIQQSLYTDDRGLISAPEAYSGRPYFGAMGASIHERLGGAYLDVPSGGSWAGVGFLGGSFYTDSSYSSSKHNAAAPLPSFTGQIHFPSVWNGSSSDGVSTSDRLLPSNDFANRNLSLTGEQNFSREWHSFPEQNFRDFRLSPRQINTPIYPASCFVYGSTSSDFAAGIHPGYLVCDAQRHILSDGNLALIDDQWSHNCNLAASEQRTAEDASTLVERRLREREKFMRELQRKEQMMREERERERQEKEDRGWQEAIPRRKPDLVENVCNTSILG